MKAVEFCYWLQGFFEIKGIEKNDDFLTDRQCQCIQKHLAMVFKHEIDPSYGASGPALDAIHHGMPAPAPQDTATAFVPVGYGPNVFPGGGGGEPAAFGVMPAHAMPDVKLRC